MACFIVTISEKYHLRESGSKVRQMKMIGNGPQIQGSVHIFVCRHDINMKFSGSIIDETRSLSVQIEVICKTVAMATIASLATGSLS